MHAAKLPCSTLKTIELPVGFFVFIFVQEKPFFYFYTFFCPIIAFYIIFNYLFSDFDSWSWIFGYLVLFF